MNSQLPIAANREHDEVSQLLPWYVNGTLRDGDRQRIEQHLQACAACREDLRLETRVHTELSSDAAVAYMPAASLKRLQARLDGLQTIGTVPAAVSSAPPGQRWLTPRAWKAASLAALGLALALVAAQQWRDSRGRPAYYTVTTAAVPVPGAVIRAVFSPRMSVSELHDLLNEAQLSIVSGPSEAGVYSLGLNSHRNPSEALVRLRAHPTVLFAELTRPAQPPSESP